ncbi:response regulator transcription factor [Streptomyces sp.]|uniref:response regulator transcription factor n=1 Tax=Streptomyces sp. TaxID=1931 RepID=UPI002F42B358
MLATLHADHAEDVPPGAPPPVTMLVVLQNELVRHGILSMLKSVPAVGSTWVYGAAAEACRLLAALRPDVVLCHGGDESTASLIEAARLHGARSLLLLQDLEVETLGQSLLASADGFLMQSEVTVSALRTAMERLSRGEMPLPADLARLLISRLRQAPAAPSARAVCLTPREQQVLSLVAQGLSNKQIARRLDLSEHGVKRHVTNLLAKLNCPNRTHAVALALREGLILPDERARPAYS